MNRGYINIYRKFLEWEWYTDSNVKLLFLHLLLKANYKEKNWKGIVVEKGQYLTSISALTLETGLTISEVRTCLKKLQSTGEITLKTTSKYTLINIVKYRIYQTDLQMKSQTNDKQIANKSQTNDKQIATTKQEKKEKQDKKENNEFVVNTTADIDAIRSFITEPLTEENIEALLKAAEGDIRKIKEKYSIVKKLNVKNLVGFLISAIKNDYITPTENKAKKTSCTKQDSAPVQEDVVISLLLNDKSLYPITFQQVNHWKELYPLVDIMQELRKMVGWIEANPKRRKTKRGILNFINSWLSKTQDKGGKNGYGTNIGNSIKDDKEIQTEWNREIEQRKENGTFNIDEKDLHNVPF